MSTPFLDVVDNVKQLKIRVAPELKVIYQNLLRRAFTRLDTFFVEEGLYKCNQTFSDLKNILINQYEFITSKKMKESTKGTFVRSNVKPGQITLNYNSIYSGVRVEGYLSHELIHLLSLGLDYITYDIPKGKVEMTLPNQVSLKAGYKKITMNNKKPETMILTYSELCENNFIKEGLTELLKQQLYTAEECPYSYHYQTKFVKLLDYVCGVKHCYKDLFQGELVTYKKYFGAQKFRKIDEYLKNTLNDSNALNIPFTESENYKNAVKEVIHTYTQNALFHHCSVKEYINNICEMTNYLSKSEDYLVKTTIDVAKKIYNRDGSKTKEEMTLFENTYQTIIDSRLKYNYYSKDSNCVRGFALSGMFAPIYFGKSYDSNYPVSANMYGMDLTSVILPRDTKRKVSFKSGDSLSEGYEVLKLDANTYEFSGKENYKKLVFDNEKCFVYDKQEELVEEGFLNGYRNKELYAEKLKESMEIMDRLDTQTLKDTTDFDA